MYIVSSYGVAVFLCIITMLCWGSWANTQKLAQKSWRFELFYWDYVLGIVFTSLILVFTLGSYGDMGRGFIADITQADSVHLRNAFLGGVVFNLANILIVVAIAVAGMAVAFPVGIGIALVLGVLINYFATPSGNPLWLFTGVFLVTLAIILDAIAYQKKRESNEKSLKRGLLFSVLGGFLMALFYRFVASSMISNFQSPERGLLTPYTAVVIFALGILVSNFLFNTILMRKPIEGKPLTYSNYFFGSLKEHLTGILGGLIWCTGMLFSLIASDKAGYAISYGLGQGATLVAAFWGVFIWKEFKGVPQVRPLLILMFLFFLVGLSLIVYAGV